MRYFIAKHKMRLMTLCVTFLMLFTSVLVASPVYAETPKEKYERLKGEYNAIGEEIEAVKGEKAKAEELFQTLQQEQQIIIEMIALNEERIKETDAEMEKKQAEIAAIREELYQNDQLYQQRLVAIYEMNNGSILSHLLSVDSFSEFFQVVDAMQRISKNDTQLLQKISDNKDKLEEQEAIIQKDIDDLNDTQQELQNNNAALEANKAAQQQAIDNAVVKEDTLQEERTDKLAAVEKAEREMIAAQKAIDNTGSRPGDGSDYVGGVFTWPVPGHYVISCYFGGSDPNGRAHRGLDISAPSGASIVACGGGTVIVATSHYSYGNYVVVDHGNGVKTLYAHCTSLLVGVGTQVSAGTPIATIGSTGFSTGPHLHLEVQEGGVLHDPLSYLR